MPWGNPKESDHRRAISLDLERMPPISRCEILTRLSTKESKSRSADKSPGGQRCEAFFTGRRPAIQARSASEWILRNVQGSTRWRFVLLMVRIAARRAKFKSPFAASGDL